MSAIAFLAVQEIPVAVRHNLQDQVRETHGVTLEIFDGPDCPGGGRPRCPVERLLPRRLGLMPRHGVVNRRTLDAVRADERALALQEAVPYAFYRWRLLTIEGWEHAVSEKRRPTHADPQLRS